MEENVEPVPQGAVDVVLGWADAALAGDFRTMWRYMDANLRLAEAQLWILASEGHPALEAEHRDVLAEELAGLESEHRLRRVFEDARMVASRRRLPPWPRERWEPSSLRKVTGEDLDGVLIRDPDAMDTLSSLPREWMVQCGWRPLGLRAYVVRFSANGWKVAGIGYSVAVPGWPPLLEEGR